MPSGLKDLYQQAVDKRFASVGGTTEKYVVQAVDTVLAQATGLIGCRDVYDTILDQLSEDLHAYARTPNAPTSASSRLKAVIDLEALEAARPGIAALKLKKGIRLGDCFGPDHFDSLLGTYHHVYHKNARVSGNYWKKDARDRRNAGLSDIRLLAVTGHLHDGGDLPLFCRAIDLVFGAALTDSDPEIRKQALRTVPHLVSAVFSFTQANGAEASAALLGEGKDVFSTLVRAIDLCISRSGMAETCDFHWLPRMEAVTYGSELLLWLRDNRWVLAPYVGDSAADKMMFCAESLEKLMRFGLSEYGARAKTAPITMAGKAALDALNTVSGARDLSRPVRATP